MNKHIITATHGLIEVNYWLDDVHMVHISSAYNVLGDRIPNKHLNEEEIRRAITYQPNQNIIPIK